MDFADLWVPNGDIGAWVAAGGAVVVFISFRRLLGVLYVDGRLDAEAFGIARGAGLLPALATAAALLLEVALLVLTSAPPVWLPWVTGATALAGGVWALERGRAAVRRRLGDGPRLPPESP